MGGRRNVHNEKQNGRPFVASDDLVQSVEENIYEIGHFTIPELSCEFLQISPHSSLRDYCS
jgi:hypothetical protein